MTDPCPPSRRSPMEHEHNICPLGDDCDLTLAYMVGASKARDEVAALRARVAELEAALRAGMEGEEDA